MVDTGIFSDRSVYLESEETVPGGKPAAFHFTGDAFEYFKIWIVNVVLTVLTLGIYSAWAKVRRKRYFYGNTVLEGSAFEYTADPVTILKGRMLAFAVFMAYVLTVNVYPLAEPFLWLIFLPFIPWVLIKALKFNARNSAYRHIRFNFDAGYRDALFVFIIIPLSLIFTLGLTYPWFAYRQRKFVSDHHRYGLSMFRFHARIAEFYKIYGLALLALLAAGSMIGVCYAYFLAPVFEALNQNRPAEFEPLSGILWIPAGFAFLIYLGLFAFLRAQLQNLAWNGTRLEEIGFESRLRTSGIFWLYLSNSIAVILSAGFLIPWAQIRMARYRIEHLTLFSPRSMDHFIAGELEKAGAAGEEVGEFFDLDISI